MIASSTAFACAPGSTMPRPSRPLQIQINLAEPHRVRLRVRPVDVLPEGAAAEQIVQLLVARG